MPAQFSLYKVTGGREVYYAAVDWETSRVWTSPTSDGAQRQARDAGLETFTEHVISRDALLRKLGVDPARPMRIDPTASSNREKRETPSQRANSKSTAAWFVPGDGAIEGETSVPQRLPPRGNRSGKPFKRGKGKSPFAGAAPIGAPAPGDKVEEDILIVDATKSSDSPVHPFEDGKPEISEKSDE